jgi:hypothetical protein
VQTDEKVIGQIKKIMNRMFEEITDGEDHFNGNNV